MYVIGFSKSGITWLSYLLSYCLNAEYSDLDFPDSLSIDQELHSYLKGGLDHQSYQAQLGKIIKTNNLDISDQDTTPVVYMVRDGRDAILSYYYSQNPSIDKGNPHAPQTSLVSKVFRKAGFQDLSTRLELSPFSRFLDCHLSEWVSHVTIWLDRNPIAIIRYEDLQAIPEQTLASLMLRLGVEVSSEVITQAVEIFDLKSIPQYQLKQKNKKSVGNPGDWQKHFSKKDRTYFRDKAGKILFNLGYEGET
ncbi:MAG: sulfotransferase domain-containing protein [Cyanobacteria bacterium P01_G01_bin.49]